MTSKLEPITAPMLKAAGADPRTWIHSNGSYEQTRFYVGAQINASNVARLKPAFGFQTAVLESTETAPIVVNGVMFLTTSHKAIDAMVNGKQYVAVVAGGNTQRDFKRGNSVFVFAVQ